MDIFVKHTQADNYYVPDNADSNVLIKQGFVNENIVIKLKQGKQI